MDKANVCTGLDDGQRWESLRGVGDLDVIIIET